MNKYIVADMIAGKLKKELGMVPKPFPKELRSMEAEVAHLGKMRFEAVLYQAEKLKKISVLKHAAGKTGAGTVVMIVADDAYDLPFILADVAFDFGKEGKIFTEFEAKPLVRDEESMRKYVEPFRKWREEIGKLPSEPVSGLGEPGEFLKANLSPIEYLRFVPDEYADQVLNFTEQFFNIFLDIYRKAEPVKDAERRKKADAFRAEYNRHVLDEDPSGVALINAFGRKKAQLFYDHLINL